MSSEAVLLQYGFLFHLGLFHKKLFAAYLTAFLWVHPTQRMENEMNCGVFVKNKKQSKIQKVFSWPKATPSSWKPHGWLICKSLEQPRVALGCHMEGSEVPGLGWMCAYCAAWLCTPDPSSWTPSILGKKSFRPGEWNASWWERGAPSERNEQV